MLYTVPDQIEFMGSDATTLPLSVLTKGNRYSLPNHELCNIKDKNLVCFTDVDGYIEQDILEFLLFSPTIAARQLFQNASVFENKANYILTMNTNNLHLLDSVDKKFIELIHFDKCFYK
jgi:hypothetical protein